ncbi:MAG: GTPase ObgE [Planctomycetota bacterium]
MPHTFIDESTILVRSGHGGSGCVSFYRGKFRPHGGPDGGDGGRGGDVILEANRNLSTLLDLGRNYLYAAENGANGQGRNCTGRSAEDLLVKLPVGTLVRDVATGELLVDLAEHGQQFVVARGGRGGRGNRAFAHATNQAPREFEDGVPAEQKKLALELKLMADVGLLGLPNAGKSTLLARVSAARPKIADYPFTTLVPQLGIAELSGERRLVVADVPGLIEGAHRGVGLGIDFLRHLERTRVLVHLIDPHDLSADELVRDFHVIRAEISRYVIDLSQRPIITFLSKADLVPESERAQLLARFIKLTGEPAHLLSAASGLGVAELLEAAYSAASRAREAEAESKS